jgi:hypothetical protein
VPELLQVQVRQQELQRVRELLQEQLRLRRLS